MVGTIICDIGTINIRFYLLEVWYPHGYCRITHRKNQIVSISHWIVPISHWIVPTSHMMVLKSHLIVIIEWVPYPQKKCGYCRMTL